MAISSPGIGSNLDVNSIVSQLMNIERQPVTLLNQKEASYQARLSAFGSLKSALASFQSTLQSLDTASKFSALKASASDSTVLSASAGTSAAAGTYSVQVTTLAEAQKLKSTPFAATSTTVGSGTLTIDFGTYSADTFTLNPNKSSKTITIAAGQSSLAGIRDAINAANAGVTAGIVNDGTGYRLTVSSNDTGVANAVRILVSDGDGNNTDTSGLSQLLFDARTVSGVKNLTETVAAKDAAFTIDGIAITKPSNTVTDAIEGVTLNLLSANSPGTATLTVARDSGSIQNSVQNFVSAYNSATTVLQDLSAYDATTKQAAVLQGDSAVFSIQYALRTVLNSALSTAGGGLTTLSDIGISFQKDGTLALDTTKLQSVINDPTKDISTLFAAVGKPTDSLVAFVNATSSTKAGTYAVNISRLATQASAVGNVVLGGTTTITAGVDDNLTLTVDGTSASVTLAAGAYTPAQLAAEIQAKINGASALSTAGSAVTASIAGGMLSITSNRYGSDSNIQTIGGTAAPATFGTVDYTNGTGANVAGTIGGVMATGLGQTLTGTGNATGLAIKVTGGSTGDRGTIAFAQGYAAQLDQLLSGMLATDGTLASRTDGINTSIKDIDNQRDALSARLTQIEARYRAQFTALDQMMSSMTQTSNFLTQQLASLPSLSKG